MLYIEYLYLKVNYYLKKYYLVLKFSVVILVKCMVLLVSSFNSISNNRKINIQYA